MSVKNTIQAGLLAATLLLACLVPVGSATAQAAAAPQEPLKVTLSLQRVTLGTDGKEVLADAAAVRPGDLLEYRAVYTNSGEARLDGIVATLPVPPGMEYQPRSASPAPALAATSSDNFAAEPLMRKVKRPDGTEALEAVPYAEYRGLRWQIGSLKPQQSMTVSARVRVSATTDGTTPAGERK
jgi:uncharacterized repeat protein (TIGR01451 family)